MNLRPQCSKVTSSSGCLDILDALHLIGNIRLQEAFRAIKSNPPTNTLQEQNMEKRTTKAQCCEILGAARSQFLWVNCDQHLLELSPQRAKHMGQSRRQVVFSVSQLWSYSRNLERGKEISKNKIKLGRKTWIYCWKYTNVSTNNDHTCVQPHRLRYCHINKMISCKPWEFLKWHPLLIW